MTSTTGNMRRLPTFRPDQNDVPTGTRTNDLLRLALTIADLTHPAQRVVLEPEDRLLLAMALPNLPDDRARGLLVAMVGELHTAEQADRLDPRDAGYVPAETYRDSAAQLARDAVRADLQVGAR
jgi:hypothetical protein